MVYGLGFRGLRFRGLSGQEVELFFGLVGFLIGVGFYRTQKFHCVYTVCMVIRTCMVLGIWDCSALWATDFLRYIRPSIEDRPFKGFMGFGRLVLCLRFKVGVKCLGIWSYCVHHWRSPIGSKRSGWPSVGKVQVFRVRFQAKESL